MKRPLHQAAWICLLCAAGSFAQSDSLDRVNQLEAKGHFKEAAGFLTTALKDSSLIADERKKLEFELDRLDRIKKDFPYSKEELLAELKKAVKGLTAAEFERWVDEGRFDSREIDGQRFFM